MRITKRTNIAIRVLMFCEVNRGRLVTKAEIAECCNTSENHLAQVINQLGQLGYLHTQRGRNGGLELGRPSRDIVIGDVFRALESHVPLTECFADVDNTCPLIDACRLRLAIQDAAEAFYAHLDEVTLDTLVCDNDPLKAIMASGGCSAARTGKRASEAQAD
ncbi:RrF2 family transcriptional regulator [Marimonas arenosa]|uniref:Rrf2 family transcriptional regulator n=1 Tax=Marimonas arenosa TaxID=1795305 RepID=A0AAE4B7I2_9RHOB|nr:Rrf2 family transcriptional regulator [Marimonas arenosa]MDQ2091536.1 Rrf2 family transcriptional regulator [Marimonas arenosa]